MKRLLIVLATLLGIGLVVRVLSTFRDGSDRKLGTSFQFDLETDFEYPAPAIDDPQTYTIDFALGYDLDENKVVLMSVMLVTGESYLDGRFEGLYDLQFGIRERVFDENMGMGSITRPDFSALSANRYIPKSARSQVKAVLQRAIVSLVQHAAPKYLTMETFSPWLPEKALAKYEEITGLIILLGYNLTEDFQDPTNGINYWFYTKS